MSFLTHLLAQAPSSMRMGVVTAGSIFVAVVLFAYFLRREQLAGGDPRLKWIAVIPLLVAMVMGFQPMLDIQSPLYRDFYAISRRGLQIHYAGFYAPLAVLIGMVLYVKFSLTGRRHKF